MKNKWVLCNTKNKDGLNIPNATSDLMIGTTPHDASGNCTVYLGVNYPPNELYHDQDYKNKKWGTRVFTPSELSIIYYITIQEN